MRIIFYKILKILSSFLYDLPLYGSPAFAGMTKDDMRVTLGFSPLSLKNFLVSAIGMSLLHPQLKHLSLTLANYRHRRLNLENFIPSAVLLPLIPKGKQIHLLFTERNGRVRAHKNQIAFPGGVKEPQDRNLLATALRECHEEIGLKKQDVEILGRLSDHYTPTGYRITPFVGLLKKGTKLCVDPRETEKIFPVPLKALINLKNFSLQKAEFFPEKFDLPFYYYRKHVIWGATGRMTRELLKLLEELGSQLPSSSNFKKKN